MGSSSSVGRAPIDGVGICSAASGLVMQEVAPLLRRTWCGAAGVSTRNVSGEVREDRRGGLLLPVEVASSGVRALTSRVATAVLSTARALLCLVSLEPLTSEFLSEALSAALLALCHTGFHSARVNGQREVCGQRDSVPWSGESWATGVEGAVVSWGQAVASA